MARAYVQSPGQRGRRTRRNGLRYPVFLSQMGDGGSILVLVEFHDFQSIGHKFESQFGINVLLA